jgi:hypothetical protein
MEKAFGDYGKRGAAEGSRGPDDYGYRNASVDGLHLTKRIRRIKR